MKGMKTIINLFKEMKILSEKKHEIRHVSVKKKIKNDFFSKIKVSFLIKKKLKIKTNTTVPLFENL
tara:strand:+ start:473 stop:670 length:198 start_codon:yes stop_codon:yes gene_type:complete